MEKGHDEMFIEQVSKQRPTDPHTPINAQLLKFTDGTSSLVVGLTKREYFAAMAMQAIISSPQGYECGYEETADYAIEHADALINQLNK
jgi:hypothetical protein